MAGTKVKAVVIGSKDHLEKDKLITLFSLENGKLLAKMKGVRGERAKLRAAKEPFTFGEYIIENGKGFNVVTSAEVIDSFYSLTKNIDKFYEGCAILDIVAKVSTPESDPALFMKLLQALKTLCYDKVKKYYVVDKFLIEIFSALGYDFVTSECSGCGTKLDTARYFNLETGELICTACKNSTCISVSGAAYSALKILANTDFDKLASVSLGGGGAEEAFHILEKNFEWRVGTRFVTII